MKSSLITSLLFSIVFLVLITSCTKNPNSIKFIPNNAHVVTVFNISSIINKGDLYNVDNLENLNKLRNNKENLKINEVQFIDKILDNPLSIGLNYDKDWFSFYINEPNQEQLFCFSAGVVNEKSITNFIQEFLTTSDAIYKIEKEENYNFTITDNHTALAWDNKKLLIVSSENSGAKEIDLKTKIKELFNLKPNEQLVNNDSFQEFYSNKKDISVWMSSNLYSEHREFKQFEAKYDLDASNNYFSFFFDFKAGQIDLDAQFEGNNSVEEFIKNNKVLNDDFNTELLDYFPNNNIIFASLSVNTAVLFEEIKENSMVAVSEKVSKVTPSELLESMGGSIAFSVFDFKQKAENNHSDVPKPLMVLAFDLKHKEVLEELITILPNGSLEKKTGYYEIATRSMLNENTYLAFNSSTGVLSNDKNLILQFIKGESISNNLNETSIASEIEYNSFYLNFRYDDEKISEEIQKNIEKSQTTSEKQLINVLKQLAESIDFKLSSENKAVLSLKLINKKENSLKVILETIDENAALIESNSALLNI